MLTAWPPPSPLTARRHLLWSLSLSLGGSGARCEIWRRREGVYLQGQTQEVEIFRDRESIFAGRFIRYSTPILVRGSSLSARSLKKIGDNNKKRICVVLILFILAFEYNRLYSTVKGGIQLFNWLKLYIWMLDTQVHARAYTITTYTAHLCSMHKSHVSKVDERHCRIKKSR